MRRNCCLFFGFLCILCVLLSGCKPNGSVPPAETSSWSGSESDDPLQDLPASEAVILLYDDYLTAVGEQGGIGYTYTYCFGQNGTVFNAIAEIRFPTEEAAVQAYCKLLKSGYPNLQLSGSTLTFAFPRRECPYYGISYRALPILLEETIYTVTETHFPTASAS